mgnify:CR=1 FL=1
MRYQMLANVGPHIIWVDGKRVRVTAGEVIDVDFAQVSSVLDKFKALDNNVPSVAEMGVVVAGPKAVYRGGGWWAVVDGVTGEQINTTAMRRDEALALVVILDGGASIMAQEELEGDIHSRDLEG